MPAVTAGMQRPPRGSGRAGRFAARRWACLASAVAWLLPAVASPAERELEYEVKAVFLERFARFVEWPGGALPEPPEPFRIGVLGDDPFRGLLEKAYASRFIRGRPVVIRHAATLGEIGPCNLLFISSSLSPRLDVILSKLRTEPVLLVGDTPGYGEAGVHLNFYLSGGKVRFELNPAALRQAGLGVSYLLQQVATPIQGERIAP